MSTRYITAAQNLYERVLSLFRAAIFSLLHLTTHGQGTKMFNACHQFFVTRHTALLARGSEPPVALIIGDPPMTDLQTIHGAPMHCCCAVVENRSSRACLRMVTVRKTCEQKQQHTWSPGQTLFFFISITLSLFYPFFELMACGLLLSRKCFEHVRHELRCQALLTRSCL